ncbi:hypothetical protein GGR54DRAFT_608378 [Hypoxylon sp. NC1633]|nr:hypothetical protein GGR54DRAFT_608378 [Hypoxylon sp. NC1633]
MSSSQSPTQPPLDYSHDGPGMIISTSIVAAFASVAVALRFWARRLAAAPLKLDDYLALSALIVHHGLLAGSISEVVIGINWNGDPNYIKDIFKTRFASEVLYILSSTFIRLSVLALYWRIFPTRSMKIECIALGSLCISWAVACEILDFVQCRPLHAFWDIELQQSPDTLCIDFVQFFLGNSIANCIIDFATLILPIREVMRLQQSTSKKLGICLIFLLGTVSFVASLTRTITTAAIYNEGVSNFNTQFVISGVATVLEVYIAIIGSCLPTLVPVYRKLRYLGPLKKTIRSETTLIPADAVNTIGKISNRRNLRAAEEGSFEELGTEDDLALVTYHGSRQVNISSSEDNGPTDVGARDTIPQGILVNQEMTWTENTSSEAWNLTLLPTYKGDGS